MMRNVETTAYFYRKEGALTISKVACELGMSNQKPTQIALRHHKEFSGLLLSFITKVPMDEQ